MLLKSGNALTWRDNATEGLDQVHQVTERTLAMKTFS